MTRGHPLIFGRCSGSLPYYLPVFCRYLPYVHSPNPKKYGAIWMINASLSLTVAFKAPSLNGWSLHF